VSTADDVRHFIDVDLLLDLWDEMVLPPAVSRAWIAWLAKHRLVTVRDCRDRAREQFRRSQAVQAVVLGAEGNAVLRTPSASRGKAGAGGVRRRVAADIQVAVSTVGGRSQ
jgi:hypothetical protein